MEAHSRGVIKTSLQELLFNLLPHPGPLGIKTSLQELLFNLLPHPGPPSTLLGLPPLPLQRELRQNSRPQALTSGNAAKPALQAAEKRGRKARAESAGGKRGRKARAESAGGKHHEAPSAPAIKAKARKECSTESINDLKAKSAALCVAHSESNNIPKRGALWNPKFRQKS